MKHLKRISGILLILTILCCAAAWLYAADYYHMDENAAVAMENDSGVTVSSDAKMAVFTPAEAHTGFIFYPGGKVEYTAYAPLMHTLAENGVLCIIPHMPLNLAVMDIDTAEKISAQYPEIDTWYIGGHSLGGAMAATHASHCDVVQGIVLLAAYSTADLSKTDLRVLSIYGTRDGVLDMASYESNFPNLPADTTERILEGGNHAQFGSYGEQSGDGKALISATEQQLRTASEILEFMGITEVEAPAYEYEQYTFWLEQDKGSALRSLLTLTPEINQFTISEPIYSSRLNMGSYTIENDVLICRNWDNEILYCFDVTDRGMVYRAADSADLYAHGSVFAENVNAQAPVPDGAVYAQLMIGT